MLNNYYDCLEENAGKSTRFSIYTSLDSFAGHIKDVPFQLTRPDRIHPRMSEWGYNVPTLLLAHNGVNLSEMEGE